MEEVIRIIYDKSKINEILNIKDIIKILEIFIIQKRLSDYISNIDVQQIRSKNLASYSSYTNDITIYSGTVDYMLNNIENKLLITNHFERVLYKNLSILQIILHEVEHANQNRIYCNENNLEAFILKISLLVKSVDEEESYEFQPNERFAEIKSYNEIKNMLSFINNKLNSVPQIVDTECLLRLLRGYRYHHQIVSYPLYNYFYNSNRKDLLNAFDWYSNNNDIANNLVRNNFSYFDRLFFGLPISIEEYADSTNRLVLSINKNFRNRISVK